MIFMIILFLTLYTVAILWIVFGFYKLPAQAYKIAPLQINFSVVIVFRNEAENLPELLQSICEIDYPKHLFEIIFVNDASGDASSEIIEKELNNKDVHFQILENKRYSNAPKKDAISLAVKKAKNTWIVTTDADCMVPKNWLLQLNTQIITENPKMVAMPVIYERKKGMSQAFQFLEGLSLQIVTMTGFGWKKPMLCNGANLAFEKDIFFEVNGYEGNNSIASGDDIFLLEKIRKLYPQNLSYLKNKEAAVITKPVRDWKAILEQRVRWASKTKHQKNTTAWLLGIAMLLGNISFIVSLLWVFIDPLQVFIYLGFMCFKLVLDVWVLNLGGGFFRAQFELPDFIKSSLIYPFVIVWVLIYSVKGNYHWKDRPY